MLRDVNKNRRFESDEVFTYTKDHLGSVKDITDNQGKLRQRYHYSAYGVTKIEKDDDRRSGQLIESNYAYTSREFEPETGCYYYRARWYCPQMEKFILEDPLGLAASPNKLQYLLNNPMIGTDPDGLYPDYNGPRGTGNPGVSSSSCISGYGTICQNREDFYCSVAPSICQIFPDNPRSNCIRACLQRKEIEGPKSCGANSRPGSVSFETGTHIDCFSACL